MSITETGALIVTPKAIAKIEELVSEEGDPALALRVAVRPGGCSGFSYEMYFDKDVADDDIVVEHGSIRVLVDSESAPLLAGATLKYNDGLMETGFTIDNPNATKSCGCGKSFS